MKKLKSLGLRLDEALYNQLEQLAKLDRRSLSQYVYYLLLDVSTDRWGEIHHKENLEKPMLELDDDEDSDL